MGPGASQIVETEHRTSMRPLRPYQAKAVADARAAYKAGKRAVLLVGPTGLGKTRLVCEFAIAAISKPGGSVIVLAHRGELLTQARDAIVAEGVDPADVGIIAPGYRRRHTPIQVASVQTLAAQIKKERELPPARVVILDEAHHFSAGAPGWFEVAQRYRDSVLLGVTATPERGDGSPMGVEAGGIFDHLIAVSSVRELQALGVLVPCVTYAPDTQRKALARSPVDAYREHGWGERCFVFCTTVAHAEQEAEAFRAAGVPAATIHTDTPWDLRRARLAAFKAQDVEPLRRVGCPDPAPLVLLCVHALTEGVDVPEASVCITARGIGHAGMMQQMVGRVLRAAPWIGKTRAIWWDLRGQSNKRNRDGTLKIGLPEMDRTYSLDGKAIDTKEDPENAPRTCKQCGAVFMTWAVSASGGRCCPSCGESAPVLETPEVKEREVFASGSGASEEERVEFLKRWAETAVDRGYQRGWVSVRYLEKYATYPPHGAVDAAMLAARKLLGVRVTPDEVAAERARLNEIAAEKGIPARWVDEKLREKFGEAAA